MSPSRDLLVKLYEAAVAAAHPSVCLPPALPAPPETGRVVVLAAGKAAGATVEAVEAHYLDKLRLPKDRLTGIAVTRHGHGRKGRVIEVVEAGHPVPDAAGLAGAETTLALADAAGPNDLVLVLVSGGASANWIAPAAGISLAAKQAVTRQLLRCGAAIGEINTVRKHLSRLKGGRLAARAHPAKVVTLSISDVPGDDPSVIGSGPTVPDPTTLADARAIVARYGLDIPDEIKAALETPANETPKPGDPVFADLDYRIVARPQDAFEQVEAKVRASGLDCLLLGDRLEGEARTVAAQHAAIAKEFVAQHRRAVILSGGELTVTLRGKGRGGPNQEYVLALAAALDGLPGVAALAADTDGIDGGGGKADDPAGAFVDETTVARARALGLDPAAFLADNDSTGFFERLGDLLRPGPTCTNINDFRAILVDR
ncbi:glycerate kinase type-2 family protein [Rhodoplanes azumiensis]|uniref:Glycerate kinase n=1 Tax=Rhodoplanes azumiensis TaxID=1897628 RepID=A0ABW5ARK6_9BRAD